MDNRIGRILSLRNKLSGEPRGIWVVPYEPTTHGYHCVVIKNSDLSSHYPIGGYNILVFEEEIRAADLVAPAEDLRPQGTDYDCLFGLVAALKTQSQPHLDNHDLQAVDYLERLLAAGRPD